MQLDFLKPAHMDEVLDVAAPRSPCIRRCGAAIRCCWTPKCKVAFVFGGQARPIPKPLRLAMKADQV